MVDLVADAGSAQDIGRRQRQEDALIAQFSHGAGPGVAVLSDGMGGHEDGDLASRILVGEMFSELFLSAARRAAFSANSGTFFRAALNKANSRLETLIGEGCISKDTGGTLVSVAVVEGRLRWLSVGDSLLYLFRDGKLRLLNEVHSMEQRLARLVDEGQMDAETARMHPHRHYLTSAVTGQPIPKVDCPNEALDLQAGDIVILASDGLNVLGEARLRCLVQRHRHKSGRRLAQALLAAVTHEEEPEQDNVSVVAIKMSAQDRVSVGLIGRLGHEIRAALSERKAWLGEMSRGLVGMRL